MASDDFPAGQRAAESRPLGPNTGHLALHSRVSSLPPPPRVSGVSSQMSTSLLQVLGQEEAFGYSFVALVPGAPWWRRQGF